MPPELREHLEALAKKNGRSVNSEIVAMIAAGIQGETNIDAVPTEHLLSVVVERLGGTLQLVLSQDGAKLAGLRKR
jgi:hypothetical protein